MNFIKHRLFVRPRAALLLALPLAALAGCNATVNTRWAESQDSAEAWQTTMAHIPIDGHGAIPGESADQTVNRVTDGTTMAAFDAAHSGQSPLEQSRRIELYVDADKLPQTESYCAVTPALESVTGKNDAAQVVGALCDGPRLVATEVVHLDSRGFPVAQVPQAVEKFKSKLLDGLASDPRQVPGQYEY